MFDLIIKDAFAVLPDKTILCDMAITNGKIVKIERDITEDAKEFIDAKAKYVLPGIIDAHVHLREPGAEEKETIETGTMSAVAGGVTSVLDMPNTNPPIIDQKTLDNKIKIAKKNSYCNIGFFLGATKDTISSIDSIKGYKAIKVYAGSSTGSLLLDDKKDQSKLLEKTNKLICFHAEDEGLIQEAKNVYKDFNDPEIHSCIRHRECALESVESLIALSKKYDRRIHICHISTEEEVELIRKAKKNDIKITCEVSPHHLFLNDEYYESMGNFIKVNPPVRGKADNDALFGGLMDKTIDIIATDHAPHTIEEKEKSYWDAPAGVPGLEFLLPLMLHEVNEGNFRIDQIAEVMSYNPAKIFDIKNKGQIQEGYDADLVIVDPKGKTFTSWKNVKSKCGWTPYKNWDLKGKVDTTIIMGENVFHNDKAYKPTKIKIL